MAYGLQTYNADGSVQLTVTDRLTRLVQSNYVYLGPRGGTTIYVPGMAPNGQWAVLSNQPFVVSIGYGYYSIVNAAYGWDASMTFLAFQY